MIGFSVFVYVTGTVVTFAYGLTTWVDDGGRYDHTKKNKRYAQLAFFCYLWPLFLFQATIEGIDILRRAALED